MFGLSLPFIVVVIFLFILRAAATIYIWHNRRVVKKKVEDILSDG